MKYLTALTLLLISFGCVKEKEHKEALADIAKKKTLKKSPEQYRAEFQIALQKGDTVEAMKVLERYQKIDSTDAGSRAAMIFLEAESRRKDRKAAIDELIKLADGSTDPAVVDLYLSLVAENETLAEVIAGLDTLIAHSPKRADLHGRRAHVLMEMERYDDAIASFANAIEHDRQNQYYVADRFLAIYLKGDRDIACSGWTIPGGGSQSYYERYCKWPEFESVWNDFIRDPNHQTGQEVQRLLSKHYAAAIPPDEKLSTHIFESWKKLSRKTSGNQLVLNIGFQLVKVLKDVQNYELRCELAKSITVDPKLFLTEVRNNQNLFDDFNEIVGAIGKELMNDKTAQQNEIAKRIVALNSVNTTDLIRIRGACLLALEKKRERLARP